MDGTCTALNLSDKEACRAKATAAKGLFCSFHARQCQAMYAGYKKRNARLDETEASKPEYLKKSKINLGNDTFKSVTDEKVLNDLFAFLFRKRNLLERVIKARKLHHSHFYSWNLDYGHQAYIDRLIDEKAKVTVALERLQRRIAEVLFEKQQWFQWVRQCQDDEDATKEKESKRVKKEAQLFKRHWKEVEARLRLKRKQEDEKRQEAYLEKAFQERQAQASDLDIEGGDDADWDPIDDALEDERNDFVDLMKRLLWLVSGQDLAHSDGADEGTSQNNGNGENTKADPTTTPEDAPGSIKTETAEEKKAKKKARAKARAREKAAENNEQDAKSPNTTPSLEVNESRDDMRRRLIHGEEFGNTYRPTGYYWVGSFENPPELHGKVPGMSEEEVDNILKDVAEAKELLFCRLLLSHASVLPAAMRADSIEEFLADPEVSTADLRDICFRLEEPTLQEIRDACADLAHHQNPDDIVKTRDDQTTLEIVRLKLMINRGFPRPGKIPTYWRSQHEKNVAGQAASRREIKDNAEPTITDFGEIDEQGEFQTKKLKIRICGRTIWNYPSEGTMVRGGWLTFSILTKGSRLEDAISLCRNWQEFWELNCLAMYRYFPSARWTSWGGEQLQSQLLKLGLIPYLLKDGAEKSTVRHQVGSSRGHVRQAHDQVETKNVMCACINRNDPVSRRFVKYLTMQAGNICLLVRDAKTGRVLLQPPEKHLWLIREKRGIGRAVKNSAWKVRAEVNEKMFETLETDKYRRWRFGFNEYYDLTIWDLEPGEHVSNIYNTIHDALVKAHRIRSINELHKLVEPVLKTLHRDGETGKVRDAKESDRTMYDELTSGRYRLLHWTGDEDNTTNTEHAVGKFCYNDADAAEDSILFPDENDENPLTAILDVDDPIWGKLTDGPNIMRFAQDADSDYDSDNMAAPHELITNEHKRMEKNLLEYETSEDSYSEDEDEDEDVEYVLNSEIDQSTEIDKFTDISGSTDSHDMVLTLKDYEHALGDKVLARRVETFLEKIPKRDNMRKEYETFLEREKAKAFVPAWHAADFDEKAHEKWDEVNRLTLGAKLLRGLDRMIYARMMEMLMWLDTHPDQHRLVERDIFNTSATVSLFFPNALSSEPDLNKWMLSLPDRTKLVDNDFKAQTPPYQRTTCSNQTISPEFLTEASKATKILSESKSLDWDLKLRLMIAKLYKTGIIEPGHIPRTYGQVLLGTEPDKESNMYIDYRFIEKAVLTPYSYIRDYRTVDLIKISQQWSQRHPNARFALYRVWTHSHFYPLTIGPEKRDAMSFTDTCGRNWHFRFMPKDVWWAEWSIQNMVDERMRPWKRMLGDRYHVKRDIVLVKGEDEADLQRYATGVAFGLQTMPWRFEIDFWKSFVNVDIDFLQGLDKAWLE